MTPSWKWLTNPETPYTWRFARRVVLKGVSLFVLANLLFALLDPMAGIGSLSLYNWLVPGRPRLPYGENPAQSYNLSLGSLSALFASHELHGTTKAPDEYRVLLIGDSSVWGVLLDPDQTLAGVINAAQLETAEGRRVRAYNLGYPVQSLTKDLLILDYALRYQPDLVVWLFTPESLAPDVQLSTQLVRENPEPMGALIRTYGLKLSETDPAFVTPDFWGKTIIGRRRVLADWLRLQLYGVSWALTGHDQTYPRFYEPRMEDFGEDVSWHGFTPENLAAADMPKSLAFEVFEAGIKRVGEIPLILIHEPTFISAGLNSDKRYNFFYPRWLMDRFREVMDAQAKAHLWLYLDLWDAVPTAEFTDSAVHLTPAGSIQLAERVGKAILEASQITLSAQR
ncbi:hypothetical protein ANRL4_02103 [Anaerolineae bacterium]|nr:hypothetical protein ANRL4_02103 [Anaerolineae bacterium]